MEERPHTLLEIERESQSLLPDKSDKEILGGVPWVSILINLAPKKLSTLVAPFDIVLPEDITAYIVTVEGSRVVQTRIPNSLPAYTPVLLENTGEDQVTCTFSGYNEATQDTCQAGNMIGILSPDGFEIEPNAGNYVLQTQNGVTNFYRVANEPIRAVQFKAFLHI